MKKTFDSLRTARLLKDDTLLRCSLGPFEISAIRTTLLQQQAALRWGWNATDKLRWSSSANANLLLASFLSGEERIRARMCMGKEYTAVTEAMALGEVRGSLDGGAQGGEDGRVLLTVDRILYGQSELFTSSVKTSYNEEIGLTARTQSAFQQYLDTSEQGKCARLLLVDREDWSGGIMIRSLGSKGSSRRSKAFDGDSNDDDDDDDDDDDTINAFSEWWDDNLSANSSGSNDIVDAIVSESSNVGLQGAIELALSSSPLSLTSSLLPSPSSIGTSLILENVRMKSCDFYCRCTKEQFMSKVGTLPVKDLVELLGDLQSQGDDATLDLTCHHCNEKHPLTLADLEAMLQQG